MAFVWCPEQIRQMKVSENNKYYVQSLQILPRFGLESMFNSTLFIKSVITYSFKRNQKRIKKTNKDMKIIQEKKKDMRGQSQYKIS